MKKLLYPLFILFLVFACIQQEDITNIVGRWDVEQVFDENGDELVGSSIDCFKESYLVLDVTGTGDFYAYEIYNEPFFCGLDTIIECEWYAQANSSDYTLQLDEQSGNLSLDGDYMTYSFDAIGAAMTFVRH